MTLNEAALVTILVEECGCAPSSTCPTSRFVEDLGIDGDDAAELFIALTARFGTDLKRLNSSWERYFQPKATNWRNRLASWSCVLGGTLLAMLMHAPPIWGLLFCLALLSLRTWEVSRSERQATVPIRVSDIAAAIDRGMWPASNLAGCGSSATQAVGGDMHKLRIAKA